MERRENDHTGRQDLTSPDVTVEKSDPTPVDAARGKRLVLGIGLVAIVFVVIAIIVIANG